MVNIRTKGATGERDVANPLNEIICTVLTELGMPLPEKPIVQRNQNQSAVGGKDLVGTFGLAIEVKRQEQLSVNSWWKQCVASANALGEVPVLIYKQNRMAWNVVIPCSLILPNTGAPDLLQAYMHNIRATITIDDFHRWFKEHVRLHIIKDGGLPGQ